VAKNNEWDLPFNPAWIAAAGIGFLALNWLKGGNEAAAAAPAPQPQQQIPQQTAVPQVMASQPFMQGGIMGMDSNGIPIVPLPGRSAQHTTRVRGARPSIPGITPQGRGQYVHQQAAPGNPASPMTNGPEAYRGETFGGTNGMGGGDLGGESF
jgi:hypothetical protein